MFCFEPRVFRLLFLPTFYSVTASFSATVADSIAFPIPVSVLPLKRSLPEFSFLFLVTMRRFYAFLELMYRLFDSFRSFLLIRLYLCLFVCLRSISAQLWFERSFCTFLFILLRHFPGFQWLLWLWLKYYLRMRLDFPSVDLGTSSKSFSWVPVRFEGIGGPFSILCIGISLWFLPFFLYFMTSFLD